MTDKQLQYDIKVDGIGPHCDTKKISFRKTFSNNLKIAIYAENGTGKTFISRMFALQGRTLGTKDTERLLSLDKSSGEFSFGLKDDISQIHMYKVVLQQGTAPMITQAGKQYKYHVFNRDYVVENIEKKSYSPDGNITGYIIGKENIDVSEEKEKLALIDLQIDKLSVDIDSKIECSRTELRKKGINSTLNECKQVNKHNVMHKNKTNETESYEGLCKQLAKLKSIPDSIPSLVISIPSVYLECLQDTTMFLSTSYTRAYFDKKAMCLIEKVQADSKFFSDGLMKHEASDENRCPFCNQELGAYGMYVLDLYRSYFDQEEAQVVNDIDKNINAVENIRKSIELVISRYNELIMRFSDYKVYIPEYNECATEKLPEVTEAFEAIDTIVQKLIAKKENIEKTGFDVSECIRIVEGYVNKVLKICENQIELSKKLGASLERSDKSRQSLHRRICNAKLNELIELCSASVEELNSLERDKKTIEESIKEKEGKSKKSKKDTVIEYLRKYLNYFFHDKYEFDETTFGISFRSHSLDKNATNVLSDGEKSIVAFCYYLASTHLLVENESDYQDLFFVMDDPISSMDFRYVYAVSDIIRGLKNDFPEIGGNKNVRFIILTHHAEFMSMLIGNKIVAQKWHLKPGDLDKINQELLMPYEYHLKDVLDVSTRAKAPSHTTPNSIRQIIETIMHFESPKMESTEQYIHKHKILRNNAYLYALMQDGSHGAIRKQPAISGDELVIAAQVTIEFVKTLFPNQIG